MNQTPSPSPPKRREWTLWVCEGCDAYFTAKPRRIWGPHRYREITVVEKPPADEYHLKQAQLRHKQWKRAEAERDAARGELAELQKRFDDIQDAAGNVNFERDQAYAAWEDQHQRVEQIRERVEQFRSEVDQAFRCGERDGLGATEFLDFLDEVLQDGAKPVGGAESVTQTDSSPPQPEHR